MRKVLDKINPAYFFAIVAILTQVVLTFVRPPFQSPDEFPHFCRAYQISEGNFLPIAEDQRVGGYLPACVKEYYSAYLPSTLIQVYKMSPSVFLHSSGLDCSDSSRIFIDFPNTSTYSLVAYLPQSFALMILRNMNCSIELQYYGSKFFAVLIYLVCMFFVIKTIPLYKWLVTLLLLIPMNQYMLNSFTGDTMTNLLVFVLLALIFKSKFSDHKISSKDLAFIFIIGVLLAFTKVVYVSLLLLLVIIPVQRFASRKQNVLVLFLLIVVPFLLAGLWSKTVMEYYPTYSNYNSKYIGHATILPGADAHKQMEHLVANKTHFFKVLYSSITREPEFYLRSYVGHFGTYMDSPVPYWFCVLAYLVIILVAIFEKNAVRFLMFDKLIIILVTCVVYCLIILAQHLVWNEVGSETFPSFQGRYLIPLFPLLFMTLNITTKITLLPIKIAITLFVTMSNAYVFNMLYHRYIKEVFITEFVAASDAEESALKKIDTLTLGGTLTGLKKRSGNNSLLINSDTTRGFVYDFKGLKQNDMCELIVWYKGNNGCVGVSGFGKDCDSFRYTNNEVIQEDKNGWKKLRMIFSLPVKCDSNQVSFFVATIGNERVFFDDVHYSVKRFD